MAQVTTMEEGDGNLMDVEDNISLPESNSSSRSDEADEADEADEEANFEAEERRRLEEIERTVLNNPRASTRPHLLLIEGYHDIGDIEKCREARERMVKHYGPGPEFWKEWIDDESRIATSDDEKVALCELYERALKEYLDVMLWLEYVQFCIGFLGEREGLDAVRNVFEKALAACGLCVRSGCLIWDAYREFEQAILTSLESACDSEEGKVKYEAQKKKVDSLFCRQLTVPLESITETRDEYVEWIKSVYGENSEIEENVERSYQKALEKLKSIMNYENAIMKVTWITTDNKYIFSKKYNEYLDQESEPARKLWLFERVLTSLYLDEVMWLKYIAYVEENIKIGSVILPVCERAVRNCEKCVKVWIRYIQNLEKFDEPRNAITAVVERAWSSQFKCSTDYRSIWFAFLDYLRRSVKWGEPEEEKQLEELRTAYNRACEHLAQWYGLNGDPECMLLQAWARMEAIHANDRGAMRRLWNDILSQGHNTRADMWMEYLNLEKCYGDTKHLRKLFPRALAATSDFPAKIGEAWLNFERDEGTLESFVNCERTVEERLNAHADATRLSRLIKRKREREDRPSRWGALAGKTVFVKKTTELGTGETAAETEVENGGQSSAEAGVSHDVHQEKRLKRKASSDEHGVTIRHDSSKDSRTVFVSNLDYSVSEDSIKEKFDSVGSVTDLRLVKDFKGRSKGYCYVEFSSSSEAEAALQKDRDPLDNRPMFVSKCDPDKMSRPPAFKYSCSLEKNKLFVKGLPLDSTKEDLEELFRAYGDLKDVRLVTYRNGHSKGLAYVEFKNEAAAAHALIKTDGMALRDRIISVAISKPPERRTTPNVFVPEAVKSLGGGAKEKGMRGRGRSQIFMPRVLQRFVVTDSLSTSTAPDADVSKDQPVTKDSAAPKTNEDFRQLLLGSKSPSQ